MRKKHIILCADDFGISAGVNAAVLHLLEKGRLSAVSCMSLGEAWTSGGEALKVFSSVVGVGLHVTLTHLPPLAPQVGDRHPSEVRRFIETWLRIVDKQKLKHEIQRQFERFIEIFGKAPDFIDGHQHVHVLPVVRDVIFDLRDTYAPKAWMRNVVDFTSLQQERKRRILMILGWRFYRQLKARGVPHNRQIFGFYDYQNHQDFAVLWAQWIEKTDSHAASVIYCHPGFPDAGLARVDRVLHPRQQEFDFLDSKDFDRWLAHRVTLVKQPGSAR